MEAFVALTETLHFGRAAKQLHLTQSTVSHRLRRLEDIVGTPLFDRTRRSVALTPAGRAFLPRARSALDQIGRGLIEARQVGSGAAGRLVVAYSGAASFSGLLEPLSRYAREAPDVVFEIKQASVAAQWEGIVRHEIDVGCTFVDLPSRLSGLEVHTLPGQRLYAWVAASHPLAEAKRVSLEALRAERWIILSRAAEQSFEDYLRRYGVLVGASPRSLEVDSLDACLEIVRFGAGITVLPRLPFEVEGICGVPIEPATSSPRRIFWSALSDNPVLDRYLELLGVDDARCS